MSKPRLLIIDDDDSIRWVLEKTAVKENILTRSIGSASQVEDAIRDFKPDAIISDIRMPDSDGLEMLSELQESHPDLPVIIMTAHSDLETAVAAFKGGAFEYLPKPFDIAETIQTIKRALAQRSKEAETATIEDIPDTEMLGESPSMQKLFVAIGRLSRSNATVLINGETGTGKELVARALHKHSLRADQPFIALNMAAIPRELIESELFGHEKGAFTGANQHRVGRFEQANGGTLFLDEIGDMPFETQTRLLRVLEDGAFYRVGGHTPIKVDVRVVAATHQRLTDQVEKGDFREDLFHRLNVIRLELPPLRERSDDIPVLARHFLKQALSELDIGKKVLTDDLLQQLKRQYWPGNVRQLENTCRWLAVMSSGVEIDVTDLPDELNQGSAESQLTWQQLLANSVAESLRQGQDGIADDFQHEFEKVLIEQAMTATSGHKQQAAQRLGWGRNTISRKQKMIESDS
jgi:two-component system nitrogen regulation response regulator GlnG